MRGPVSDAFKQLRDSSMPPVRKRSNGSFGPCRRPAHKSAASQHSTDNNDHYSRFSCIGGSKYYACTLDHNILLNVPFNIGSVVVHLTICYHKHALTNSSSSELSKLLYEFAIFIVVIFFIALGIHAQVYGHSENMSLQLLGVIIFTIECVFRASFLMKRRCGWGAYFRDPLCILDVVILVVDAVGLLLEFSQSTQNTGELL